MSKNTKQIIALWAFVLVGFYMISKGTAESDRNSTAERTMRSDGDGRYPFRVSVGSMTPINPFGGGSAWLWDKRRLRSISVLNPSPVELYIGTWSAFTSTASAWWVAKNSGTWTTFNHATFYMPLGNGASTAAVYGLAEYDIQVNISSPNQTP